MGRNHPRRLRRNLEGGSRGCGTLEAKQVDEGEESEAGSQAGVQADEVWDLTVGLNYTEVTAWDLERSSSRLWEGGCKKCNWRTRNNAARQLNEFCHQGEQINGAGAPEGVRSRQPFLWEKEWYVVC